MTYLIVSVPIEGEQGSLPEVEDSVGAQDNVSVVQLVIMRNPASDESPEGLDSWVSAESSGLLWLATCNNMCMVKT